MTLYSVEQTTETLLQAICLYEEALVHVLIVETREDYVENLGNALWLYCYSHRNAGPTRVSHCIALHRELLELRPSGHPLRDEALHRLARALHLLAYELHLSGPEALTEAIQLNREAAQLRPPGHPDRNKTLNNLAIGLTRRFEVSGDMSALQESIVALREVLQHRPPGHPQRDCVLENLSEALTISFDHLGLYENLVESISYSREALQLRPAGHPRRYRTLNNLGVALQARFRHHGTADMEALIESVIYHRDSLLMVPESHPERSWVMANLAAAQMTWFRERGDSNTLDEAIHLLREASGLFHSKNHLRDDLLNDLAEALELKSENSDNLALLSEVDALHRKVLETRLPGHPRRVETLHNMARVLCGPQFRSWEEALALYQEALDICLRGYFARAKLLSDMSRCFLDIESPFFDIVQGVRGLAEIYADDFSHITQRLRSARSDLQRVEDAYQAITKSTDHSLKGQIAEIGDHILRLYVQVIGLLPRAANFGIDCRARLRAVIGSDEIARNAAARAIMGGRIAQALELLEQGRGVFWSQSLHLRNGGFDGVPDNKREKLERLLRRLDHGARTLKDRGQTAEQREGDIEMRRRLNDQAEALILEIRAYPALDRFLLAPGFQALIDALPDGFVVVANASRLGCHGLLCNRAAGLATSIELRLPRMGLNPADLRARLPRNVNPLSLTRGMRLDSGSSGSLQSVLSLLWSSIVQPIIGKFSLQVRCIPGMMATSTDTFQSDPQVAPALASGGV
jgi:tetratricopeptide (TPR) repeat protein